VRGSPLVSRGAQGPSLLTSNASTHKSSRLGFQDTSIAAHGAALLATQFVWRDDHGAWVCDAGQHFSLVHPGTAFVWEDSPLLTLGQEWRLFATTLAVRPVSPLR